LLLTGVEHVRIAPEITRVSPFDFYDYPISHSLLTVLAWATAIAMIYYFLRSYRTGAWIVALCVVSHWVLDWIMHRPDLPLWPGNSPKWGLGLWNSWPLSLTSELAVFGLGVWLYVGGRRTRPGIAFWSFLGFVVVAWIASLVGGVPPSERALAYGGLSVWLLVPWATWADRTRSSQTQ
jgi:hypothetical protein